MRWRPRAAVGVGLLGLLAVGLLVSPDAVLARVHPWLASPWFPVVLVGLYLLRPVLVWPISALSVLVGYRYGLVVGLPVALTGAVATSLVPYAAARWVDRRTARGHRGLFGRFAEGSQRYFAATGDLRGVVAARLAPTPAEAISGAAGAAGVPVVPFAVGTAVGELPWTVAAVAAGASAQQVTAGGKIDPRVAILGALAAALLLASPAYRWLRNASTSASTDSR